MRSLLIIFSLLIVSFTSFAEEKRAGQSFFIEANIENSSDADIYGGRAGIMVEGAFNSVNLYVGLGLLKVDLTEKDYRFTSLRGFMGISPAWEIAPYAEVGIDLLEEIFNACDNSNDDYCSTDPSFALGVRWNLSSNVLLNAYHKWYEFDGPILTKTYVNTYGFSVGIKF